MSELYQYHQNTATELTDKGERIVPRSSVGLNRILCYLAECSQQPNPPTFNTYLVNLFTMVRNNADAKDPLQSIGDDISTLKEYLSKFISYNSHDEASLLLYYPTYKLPPVYRRTPNKKSRAVQGIFKKLSTTFRNQEIIELLKGHLSIYVVRTPPGQLPAKVLHHYIRRLTPMGLRGSVCMINHVPLDLHVANHIPDLTLLESFTAEMVKPKQFGEKIFKNPNIPFNQFTHLAFGDSLFLKPYLQRQKRKKAFEAAEQDKWLIHTIAEQLKWLINLGVDRKYLSSIKLY